LARRSDPNEVGPPVVAAGLLPTVVIDIAAANPTRVAHPVVFTLALRAAEKKPGTRRWVSHCCADLLRMKRRMILFGKALPRLPSVSRGSA
jgi:hypothetical protein